jgi:hypothetical protein
VATLLDLDNQVAAAVALWAGAPTRLDSDYLDEHEAIPAGGSRFQLRVNAVGKLSDSNEFYQVAIVDLVSLHRLADPVDERAYTRGAMQTNLALATSLSWWRALAAVYAVEEPPSVETERVGNVVFFSVEARLRLAP